MSKTGKRTALKAAAILLLFGLILSLTACSKPVDHRMASFVKNDKRYEAEEILKKYGLDDSKKHAEEEYQVLKGEVTEDNLCGFYLRLGEFESEKVVPLLGYADWEDYLKQHGYTNAFGKGSFDEWERTWLDEYDREMSDAEKASENTAATAS